VSRSARPGGQPRGGHGQITADAPTINPATGGLVYSTLRNFNVRGVVVQLLDADNANAVLATTATDANGLYTFNGVLSGKNVVLRVSAQVSANRARPARARSTTSWCATTRRRARSSRSTPVVPVVRRWRPGMWCRSMPHSALTAAAM
jgi:hypothetical protein